MMDQLLTILRKPEAFPIRKVKQDKAVDTRAACLFRVTLSRNLFPIGFSRNCRSDMGKRELDERFERPVSGTHADRVNGLNWVVSCRGRTAEGRPTIRHSAVISGSPSSDIRSCSPDASTSVGGNAEKWDNSAVYRAVGERQLLQVPVT
jgi:hypothetical protein